MSEAGARARSNIAFVKYWGKRDEALVLPHTGSLSLTLDALATETRVRFSEEAGPDEVQLDGERARPEEARRVSALLDLVRAEAQRQGVARPGRARVESRNDFPPAAGLASSASGFAALAAAAAWAAGLDLSPGALSILARRGSGSACRSVLGGFVEWVRGERADGEDSVARPLLARNAWDVSVCIAVVEAGRKERSSRDAMRDSATTSPFFDAWVRTTAEDLESARAAVLSRDLERLGEVAERSFLRMHAVALGNAPPAIFWKPPTLALLERVRGLRAGGVGAWATVDAGPHVAVLSAAGDSGRVAESLRAVSGVREVRVCRPGPGVERL